MYKIHLNKMSLAYFTAALSLGITMGAHAANNQNRQQSSYYHYQTNGSFQQYQGQGPYLAEAVSANSSVNNTTSVSDQELVKKIHDRLSSGLFSKGYNQINIEVNHGKVTLQGNVKTWDDKDKIEKEIRHLDGVKSLKSEIQVQDPDSKEPTRAFPQDTYGTSEDDQLNKKIRDKVSKGILWDSYESVILNTSNGVVTLEGSVETIGDQQKLATEIQKIEGVKTVKSNLKVKKH
jgi:osmotically-inducible protein OsmY